MSLLECLAVYNSVNTGNGVSVQVLDLVERIRSGILSQNTTSESGQKLSEALQILEELFEQDEENEEKYHKAVKLLEEAKDLGDSYSLCLLFLLDRFDGSLFGIKPISEQGIREQEHFNWSGVSGSGKTGDHDRGFFEGEETVKQASEQGNKYAQYELGCILTKQGKENEAIIQFKRSHLQGHRGATYILVEYYYGIGDENYKGYLEKLIADRYSKALFFQGEILLREGKESKALEYFTLGASQGHQECSIYLILLTRNEEREIIYERIIDERTTSHDPTNINANTCRDKRDLLSYERLYLKGKPYSHMYKFRIKSILKKIQDKFPEVNLDIDGTIEKVFFQRNIFGKHCLGAYFPETGEIAIDMFLHSDGTILPNETVVKMLEKVLCHEIIHKISIESSRGVRPPRFIEEGITTSIEEYIIGSMSIPYPQERMIFEELLSISGIQRKRIFEEFMVGGFWYINSILQKHIGILIEKFSNEREFSEIAEEMKRYQQNV